MVSMGKTMKRIGQLGQGMVEYALILVLVAIAAIVIVNVLGGSVSKVFSNAVNAL